MVVDLLIFHFLLVQRVKEKRSRPNSLSGGYRGDFRLEYLLNSVLGQSTVEYNYTVVYCYVFAADDLKSIC